MRNLTAWSTIIIDETSVASIIISIAIILFFGFAMTRLTKKLRLPNVTAYILTGILIGPYCLNLIPETVINGMDFLPDIALAFIAFSTGEFFKLSTLKKNGLKVVVITVLEACLATVVVFIATYWVLGVDLVFSIVISALASATAPASTVMTIRQTGAHGDFVDTLLQVVALDDVVGLIEYSVAISLALAATMGTQNLSIGGILKPVIINIAVMVLGGIFGVFMKLLLQRRSTDNRLIVSISLLFAFCGICALLDVSPLLGCMSMGMVYINLTDDEKLFQQLNYFTPPILLLFFVRSGLSFRLDALVNTSAVVGSTPLLIIGVVYFFTRIIGKYMGAFLGCLITHKRKEVRNYLGLALVPQAGVAIGLAAMGARTLGGETGVALETVILASSVLYELIGPACAKLSLYLSKSYTTKLEKIIPAEQLEQTEEEKTAVELLIERIQLIQAEMGKEHISKEEQAFQEAAEEQLVFFRNGNAGTMRNRRV
ncbi:MAG: cation:proton antiporter [Roseburia sp.]|nr:cation:proton antiporter [Roseburia sp.]